MAVHLAAVRAVVRSGGVDPDLVAVNALSGMRLAEELGRVGAARLVSCGSSSEYGSATTTLVESASLRPDDAYGATKAAGAHLALAAARAAGVEAVHLRPFSVYGAGEREERLVAGLLRALVEGRHVALTDGRQARDFVYVDDVAGAVVRALTARDVDGEAINVGTGVETTVRHLALLAADIAGADRSLLGFGELPYRPAERFGWRASTRKALDLLRWQATTPLTVGLEHTLDAMRASRTREGERPTTERGVSTDLPAVSEASGRDASTRGRDGARRGELPHRVGTVERGHPGLTLRRRAARRPRSCRRLVAGPLHASKARTRAAAPGMKNAFVLPAHRGCAARPAHLGADWRPPAAGSSTRSPVSRRGGFLTVGIAVAVGRCGWRAG
jgi:nucleoside-diphosphate-sugar epimerase